MTLYELLAKLNQIYYADPKNGKKEVFLYTEAVGRIGETEAHEKMALNVEESSMFVTISGEE